MNDSIYQLYTNPCLSKQMEFAGCTRDCGICGLSFAKNATHLHLSSTPMQGSGPTTVKSKAIVIRQTVDDTFIQHPSFTK